eukprot:861719-Prymnesium_polylepis.1
MALAALSAAAAFSAAAALSAACDSSYILRTCHMYRCDGCGSREPGSVLPPKGPGCGKLRSKPGVPPVLPKTIALSGNCESSNGRPSLCRRSEGPSSRHSQKSCGKRARTRKRVKRAMR